MTDSISIIVFSFLIASSLTAIYWSYGNLQYYRGRLKGFKDCSTLSSKTISDLVNFYENNKVASAMADAVAEDETEINREMGESEMSRG
jgi:hypothetical protein